MAAVTADTAARAHTATAAAQVEAKGWPEMWLKYDVLITDPGIPSATLAAIRAALPGRRLVAYTCMG